MSEQKEVEREQPWPAAAQSPAPGGERSAEETISEEAFAGFHDLPIDLSVQLDRRRMTIGEVLELELDSVISLTRSAGENVDLLLEGMRVGSGEIVVIEDMMGLRLTDLKLDTSPTGGRR